MTIDELLIELGITTPPDAGYGQRFQAELLAQQRDTRPDAVAGTRRILAGALVRAAVWLDRRAGERILKQTLN